MTAILTTIQASPALSSPGVSVAVVRSGGQLSNISVLVEPMEQATTETTVQQPPLQDVQQAVKQANQSVQGLNQSISFGYEEKLGELVVQISDKATGEVIQQFPSKDFIQFQIHMREMVGLLLDKQA